jgi:hypothetical protein
VVVQNDIVILATITPDYDAITAKPAHCAIKSIIQQRSQPPATTLALTMTSTSTMLSRRQEGPPMIGGTVGGEASFAFENKSRLNLVLLTGFIALVVVLSIFIILSIGAVVYLCRTRHPDDHFEDVVFFPNASSRRQRNFSSDTTATTATSATTKSAYSSVFGSTTKPRNGHKRTNTDDSTVGVKEKLAGMFRSIGGRGGGRNTSGWERTAGDEDWDDGEPATLHAGGLNGPTNMTELGLRTTPNRAVIVQPHPTARSQHPSEHVAPYDPYESTYTTSQQHQDSSYTGYQTHEQDLRQPPSRRRTMDSDDLSDTSTIVAGYGDRPVPPPLPSNAAAYAMTSSSLRNSSNNNNNNSSNPTNSSSSGRPGPGPIVGHSGRRVTGTTSASTSPPSSFYSARMDFTPEEAEEHEVAIAMPRFASPTGSPTTVAPVYSFNNASGTRFRENL